MMRLTKVTIKGFRGFRDEQPILLDADFVVVYGLNGSGKSSLTEAIEWLFFGEISRQRLSRCKSEYQHEEYLRNLFYDGADDPYVEVCGRIGDKAVTVRKELVKGGATHLIDGREVTDFRGLGLKLESYFRPMLAQTEIRALVDTEQKDRWVQLSSILGQDDLTRLREHLVNLRNSKRDSLFKQQENKLSSLIDDVQSLGALPDFEVAMKEMDPDKVLHVAAKIAESQAKDFESAMEAVRAKQKSLLNTEMGQRITDITFEDTKKLADLFLRLQSELQSLLAHSQAASKSGLDHQYLDFLDKGRAFIDGLTCPFCKAQSLLDTRVKEIDETIESATEARRAKTEFDNILDTLEDTLHGLPEKLATYFPPQDSLKLLSQKLSDMEFVELSTKTQQIVGDIGSLIGDVSTSVAKAAQEHNDYLENVYFHGKPDDVAKLDKPKATFKTALDRCRATIEAWVSLKAELLQAVPVATGEQQSEIRKWILVEQILTFFQGADRFCRQAHAFKIIDSVRAKLETFEKAEVKRLLEEHAEEIGSYYTRLNQGEDIQFSGIEVKGGKYRQAQLKASAFGKDVNPVTFFSEAHTNSLALSIYFPQRVDRNDSWECLILDDPVQSMDENHTQALIEILADTATRKQVIVLTHSKSFFKRLRARVSHSKPLVYQFYNNDDKGPKVSLEQAETKTHINSVIEHSKRADSNSLETASNELRKAIESVLVEFLLARGISFTKTQRLQKKGISYLFSECETEGLPASETSKLKSLLDVSSENSHAWSIADTSRGGLKTSTAIINNIYDKFVQ